MINLEIPKKFKPLASQANQVATEVFRPISRKYDEAEHSYPKELDMLASLIDGMNEGSDIGGAGAAGVRRESNGDKDAGNRNQGMLRVRRLLSPAESALYRNRSSCPPFRQLCFQGRQYPIHKTIRILGKFEVTSHLSARPGGNLQAQLGTDPADRYLGARFHLANA